MSKSVKRVIIIVLLIAGVFFPYNDLVRVVLYNPGQYQKKYNNERIKLGVLPIPDSWKTKNDYEFLQSWFPPNIFNHHSADANGVFRAGKLIITDKNGIVKDIDYISNIDKVKHSNQSLNIEFSYKYKTWFCTYMNDSLAKRGRSDTITKEKADSILAVWNINYKQQLTVNGD